MQFILTKDLDAFILPDILEDVVGGDLKKLDLAEGVALEEVKQYLGQRPFDLDKIFISIPAWDAAKAYLAGEPALDDDNVVYTAYEDNTGQKPADNVYTGILGGEWLIRDPRNLFLVKTCIDVMLFYAHDALASDKHPQLREENYNRAIGWLELVRDGKLSPNLPLLEGSEPKGSISYGSMPKRVQHY